ncbi:MAG: HAMP domain-containing protein [Candidatus Omnitrophica bacterium]|nr:HAMP domain-containing protein [Candidatus Omnitrophota bacterium]
MSINKKLIILSLALIVLPMILIGTLIFFSAKRHIEREIMAKLEVVADLKVDKIETFFYERASDVALAQNLFVIKVYYPIMKEYAKDTTSPEYITAKEMLDEYVNVFQKIYRYRNIRLVDLNKIVVYSSNPEEIGKTLPIATDSAFIDAQKGVRIGNIYSREENQYSMLVAAPLHDIDNKLVGVVVLEIDMNPIYKFIQETTGLGKTGETLIARHFVGEEEEVLFLNPLRHEPKAALNKKILFGDRAGASIQKAVQGKEGKGVAVDYRGKKTFSVWRYIKPLNWELVAKIDIKEVLRPVFTLSDLIAGILIVTILLDVIVAFWAARSILRPIKLLEKGVGIIGAGNLDYKVGTKSKDEIGQLSRAFDKMTEDLKKRTISIGKLNEEVAERRRVDEAIKKSNRIFNSILEMSPFGIYIINDKGGVDYVNSVMLEISGNTPNEFKSINFFKLPTYKELGLYDKIVDVFENGKSFKMGAVTYTSFHAKKTTIRNFTGIPLEREGAKKALIFVEDITEQKNAEMDIREAEQKEKEALDMKANFISVVSHELRTPLTSIKEGIALVSDGTAGEVSKGQKEFLDIAKRNVDRLARLINDVLDYQKLETGRMGFSIMEENINEIIGEVVEEMLPAIKSKELNIVESFASNLPPIRCDRDRVKQVLINLVNNAMKFTDKGNITIASQKVEGYIQVSVSDTGIGIKEEDLDKLFKSFMQLHVGKERKTGSTGLGLAISKKIIEEQGGKIGVESDFGKGSTFSFMLPIK